MQLVRRKINISKPTHDKLQKVTGGDTSLRSGILQAAVHKLHDLYELDAELVRTLPRADTRQGRVPTAFRMEEWVFMALDELKLETGIYINELADVAVEFLYKEASLREKAKKMSFARAPGQYPLFLQ